MVSVEDIKKDLPAWPDDVIEQWLKYFANEPDCGWPPPDPLGEHRWKRLLGGKPLSWWKQVTWEKKKVLCRLDDLAAKAKADVSDIIDAWNDGTADATTKKRVAQPWVHIKNNGVFPRALVTMQRTDGMSLIDGSHRMAAFVMFQGFNRCAACANERTKAVAGARSVAGRPRQRASCRTGRRSTSQNAERTPTFSRGTIEDRVVRTSVHNDKYLILQV
jgi:hypothetical protein